MFVDENRKFQLTNFKKGNKFVESDHNLTEIKLDIEFENKKTERKETFNLRDEYGQISFKELTTTTTRLTNSLNKSLPFQRTIKLWQKTVNSFIHQSFTKVRSTKRKFKENEVGHLIEQRKKLKMEMKNNPTEDNEKALQEIEANIATKTDDKLITNIKEAFGLMTGDDGAINVTGMWSLKKKKKAFPQIQY